MMWVIIGAGLPALRVRADSFDQALKRARYIDPGYCGGYVDDDDE